MRFHPCPDTKPHGRHEWYKESIFRRDCAGICAHCRGELKGYDRVGGYLLCHDDNSLDCYVLVERGGHPMPCALCLTRGGQGDFEPGAPRDTIDDEEFATFDGGLRSAREES